jgi:hypothetical protein
MKGRERDKEEEEEMKVERNVVILTQQAIDLFLHSAPCALQYDRRALTFLKADACP